MRKERVFAKKVIPRGLVAWRIPAMSALLAFAASFYLGAVVAEQTAPTPPTEVVRSLIQAAKANDLDQVLHRIDFSHVAIGMHGRSGTNAVSLLRSIDLSSAELVGRSKPLAGPSPIHEHVIVRTSGAEMRFELKLRDSETVLGTKPYEHINKPVDPHYLVTEIHPHP